MSELGVLALRVVLKFVAIAITFWMFSVLTNEKAAPTHRDRDIS